MATFTADTPLRRLDARVGPKLTKHRGLETVGDLLWFLPRRYLPRQSDLGRLTSGAYAVVVGEVREATTRQMRGRRGRMLNVVVTDGRGELRLTFFSAWGHEQRLVAGATGLFAGTVSSYRGQWQLAHPAYELFEPDEAGDAADAAGALIPVYPHVPGLQSWTVGRLAQLALSVVEELPDPLPDEVRERRRLPGLMDSLRGAHQPGSQAQWQAAQARFRFDEALVVQVVLAQRRLVAERSDAVPRVARPGGLREAFEQRLPFALTEGQLAVGKQIEQDLSGHRPMHRLLQGEVGSGKTVVALRAMLTVIDSGGQAVLLAPTEVLAAQHHRTMTAMLGDLAAGGMLGGSEVGTQVGLLTAGLPAPVRRRALEQARVGEAGIVVGTHALIQDQVEFHDLALVVVDEQHRFGVRQRDALREKSALPPHLLVMTATPIPRTVAMTVFGDMETSTLTELPRGRSPIASHVVANPRWLERTWQRVAEEVAAGHQAYVVCPRIGDERAPTGDDEEVDAVSAYDRADQDALSEGLLDVEAEGADAPAPDDGPAPMRAVLEVVEELRALPALAGRRVEVLHGRQQPEVKDETMRAFAAGGIDVLVSTTVIEVGVDVANATVMVVLDAERFGISQLHQLRGRVGRGSAAGLCLLVPGAAGDAGVARLDAVASTTDGFELARLDLELRREGDVLGARQSGRGSQLRLLSLLRDEDVIIAARSDAHDIVMTDPDLQAHPVLRERVQSALDEEQAAYLERG